MAPVSLLPRPHTTLWVSSSSIQTCSPRSPHILPLLKVRRLEESGSHSMTQITAGSSLISGVQNISAFLPILGTEQCEKHVGEALKGGYLYAAASRLSIFGCLGIVKACAAIFVASVSSLRTDACRLRIRTCGIRCRNDRSSTQSSLTPTWFKPSGGGGKLRAALLRDTLSRHFTMLLIHLKLVNNLRTAFPSPGS